VIEKRRYEMTQFNLSFQGFLMLIALSLFSVLFTTQFCFQSHQSQRKVKNELRKINAELHAINTQQQHDDIRLSQLVLQLKEYERTVRSDIMEQLELHKLFHPQFDLKNFTQRLDEILTPLFKKNAPK
jgi:septal ring factor EnvC (AmiA/AmiB activator)